MEKRWTLRNNFDESALVSLSSALKIHPVLCRLLVQRGITTYEQARHFFRPSLHHLHDPFLMKDMDKAVERINEAIDNKEKILVYGDYDVDGTSAVAVMYMFLKSLFAEVEFYIPDRYVEGYGVSFQAMDYASFHGFTLVIALDCGIKSVDKVKYAKDYGIDFIICDHHRPGSEVPDAYAVLDPKQNDCNYPYKELTGCAIGFKLVQALAQNNQIPFSEIEQYLDLVAISICADIVEILDENRVLVYYGLLRLKSHMRFGLKTILEMGSVQLDKEFNVNDVVFSIAPRINAAGRIESGKQAVELLIAKDEEIAKNHGFDINEKNSTRKELDSSITEQALSIVMNDEKFEARKTTVVYNPDWSKGVIGIVASRLTEKFYRPTIVLTQTNGYVSGSARSVKDFDVYNAIEACSDLLDQFGGHMYAAGLTMKTENVEPFKAKFEEVVSATIEERMLTREIDIDAELNLSDITPRFYKILKQFSPFGPGNLSPIFMTRNVKDFGYGRIVGTNHLKLSLQQVGSNVVFDAIAFQQGEHFPLIENKGMFDVCYHIDENTFNGRTTLQLVIKDIRPSSVPFSN